MHTSQGKMGTRFHFNSDLSGDVIINSQDHGALDVPGEDLIEFVLDWLDTERVAAIENAAFKPVRERVARLVESKP